MSATLGDVSVIAESLKAHTDADVDIIADAPRPVPLSYEYVKTPIEGTVELAIRAGETPLYIVHFSQDAALDTAQSLASYGVATKEQREAIKNAMESMTQKVYQIFGKLYQQEGGQPGAGEGPQVNDDGTIDADAEVK